jgi:PAS domain S-box-containing protein
MHLTDDRPTDVTVAARHDPPSPRRPEWIPLAYLAATGVLLAMMVAIPAAFRDEGISARTGALGVLLATVTAGGLMAWASTRARAWPGTRLFAAGVATSGLLQAIAWVYPGDRGVAGAQLFSVALAIIVLSFLASMIIDFLDHVGTGRAALLWDVALMATLVGATVYVLLHQGAPPSRSIEEDMLTALIAASAVVVVTGWGVLELWCPTPVHLWLFGCAALMSGSAVALDHAQLFGWPPGALVIPEAGASLALLILAGILVVAPRLNPDRPRRARAVWWIRPVLLAITLMEAGVLLVVALFSPHVRLGVGESVAVSVVLLGTVGLRAILNQVRMARSSVDLERALDERETAIASLRSAGDVVASSEARHRLLFESAVDGVVELDSKGTIVRANAAFCSMVRLPFSQIVGSSWNAVAGRSSEGSESLAQLPETGEAILASGAGTTYLEARSSVLPTTPPGRLLLIRDVSETKTAEQTIRTLFQFLQDRDEDRTRLLQRTNAAIEAERNRIARDLHDVTIQGISAIALSLGAVKLMIESGDMSRAAEILESVSQELSVEATSLRQIMSDLRPPVLEERGLVPAVRDLADRLSRDAGIPVTVTAPPTVGVPPDLEILAYRVVQEALSNIAKHAEASSVNIRIDSDAGTL